LLGVLRRDVDGHVVVQDLDRQVLALLAEHVAPFLLHNRACPVVWIHHLVADFVQARPFRPYVTAKPAGLVRRPRGQVYQKALEMATFSSKTLLSREFAEERGASSDEDRHRAEEDEAAPKARGPGAWPG